MKKFLIICVFVSVFFAPMSSFGMKGWFPVNNPQLFQGVSKVPSSGSSFKAFIAAGVFVGALAVNYIWTYSNIFGVDTSSDKGLDIDADKRLQGELLDKLTKEDDPGNRRKLFEAPKNYEEEKLKKMSEKYWREQIGYDLSKELERDRENLKNKIQKAKASYSYLKKDEADDLVDDGYDRNGRGKVTSFNGISSLVKDSGSSDGRSSGVTAADGGNGNSASSESETSQEYTSIAQALTYGSLDEGRRCFDTLQMRVARSAKATEQDRGSIFTNYPVDKVVEALEQNSVRIFTIEGDREYPSEVGERIFGALKKNESVQTLIINGELPNGWDVLLADLFRSGVSFHLQGLCIDTLDISNELGGAIAEFLKFTDSLEDLEMIDINLEKQGSIEIIESLKANDSLRRLCVYYCILHKEAIIKLGEALVNDKLEELCFRYNSVSVLAKDCTGKVGKIRTRQLDGDILIPLVESLKLNESLRRIEFVSFKWEPNIAVTDGFITALASTLRANKTLQFLKIGYLSGCGEDALFSLRDALGENKSLRGLIVYVPGERALRILAEYLMGKGSLQEIIVVEVNCENVDAAILADALEINDFLRVFSCVFSFMGKYDYVLKSSSLDRVRVVGERYLEKALIKNVCLMSVPNSNIPLIARLLSINVFLNEQLPDAEVSELREKKAAMMRLWGDRKLEDVDEKIFAEEIKLIFKILKMEEEIEKDTLTKEQLKRMLKEMSSIFDGVFVGVLDGVLVEDRVSYIDRCFFANKMFWVYRSAISSLNKIADISDAEKGKLENKCKEMIVSLLAYLYGSCLKFSIENRGDSDGHKRSLSIVRDIDVVVGGFSADDYKRLLSTTLVEYILGKDEWQSWEEHFANKETRGRILKYFVEVILHRKEAASSYGKGIDPFFDVGIVVLQRVLFDLFGEEEAETVIEFKKKEDAVTEEELMVYVDGFYPNEDHFSDCEQFVESVLKLEMSLKSLVNRVSQDGVDISNKEEIKEAAEMLLNLTRFLRDLCVYC